MNWSIVFQTFTTGLAGIGAWFLYSLVKEFKDFKKETSTDISSLKKEREKFQITVTQAEQKITGQILEVNKIHNEFRLEIKSSLIDLNTHFGKLKDSVSTMNGRAENFNEFLKKALKLSKHMHDKLRAQEHELRGLKIEFENLTIFKNGK